VDDFSREEDDFSLEEDFSLELDIVACDTDGGHLGTESVTETAEHPTSVIYASMRLKHGARPKGAR
jgi:hypothetical protein